MSWAYRLMYAVGFTPWDRGIPAELHDLVEGLGALPAGRALDLGSGLGTKAIYLAGLGWRVTGVEMVSRAIGRARARAHAAGAAVDFRRGDVTRLSDLDLEPGFDLFFDFGCYHGLNDAGRSAYARGVTQLAAPRATLLMMAFGRASPPVSTAVTAEELRRRFAGWDLVFESRHSGAATAAMRRAQATWYRLRRASPEPLS